MQEIIKDGYTRVTEVLALYSGYQEIPDFILNRASERGTFVHQVIECILCDMGYPRIPDKWGHYIGNFCIWRGLNNNAEIYMPDRFYCDELKITGKIDGIIVESAEHVLVDFKTSKKFNPTWIMQMQAYAYLARLQGIDIKRAKIVQLDRLHETEVDISDEKIAWFKGLLGFFKLKQNYKTEIQNES